MFPNNSTDLFWILNFLLCKWEERIITINLKTFKALGLTSKNANSIFFSTRALWVLVENFILTRSELTKDEFLLGIILRTITQ
eukprot:Pgem_evm1s5472